MLFFDLVDSGLQYGVFVGEVPINILKPNSEYSKIVFKDFKTFSLHKNNIHCYRDGNFY